MLTLVYLLLETAVDHAAGSPVYPAVGILKRRYTPTIVRVYRSPIDRWYIFGAHRKGANTMQRPSCPNKGGHGINWYQRPDMTRLYIRTTETDMTVPWKDRKPKRSWVPVGWICPDENCRTVKLDNDPEGDTE